jgi:hypothetical protein
LGGTGITDDWHKLGGDRKTHAAHPQIGLELLLIASAT